MARLYCLRVIPLIAFVILAGGCSVKEKFSGSSSSSSSTATPREISFVDTPSRGLGNVPVNSSRLVILPLSSTGSGDATVTASSNSDSHFTFNGGTFPGTGGTCTQPIQGNCSIALLFTAPTSSADVGVYSDVLTLTYTSGGSSKTTTLTLTANATIAAALTVNAAVNYSFGTKTVGTTTDQTLTVANSGLVTAGSLSGSGLSGALLFKGGSYPGTGGTCGTSLSSGASCTLVIRYAPTSAGNSSQNLAIAYHDGTAVQSATILVTGTAISVASLSITAPAGNPYDFGTHTITAPETDATFTVSNTGGQSATSLSGSGLSSPFLFKGGSYPGTGGTCGATLAMGATCTLVIGFLPVAAGTYDGTLSLSYSDGLATQTLTRGVHGVATNAAVLTISNGVTYDFGSKLVGTSTDFTFSVSNTGTTSATTITGSGLAAPFTYKGGTYPGTGGTCGGTLAASATCTVVVRFTPSAAGVSNSNLVLNYNDGGAATTSSRAVTGTGYVLASITITSPVTTPYDFGTRTTNAVELDVTFTIKNTGNGSASSLTANGLASPFLFKGGAYPGGGTCGATLAAGASCTIVIGFLPSTVGTWDDTLNIQYNDGVSTQTVSRDVHGISVLPAALSISDGPTYDFGSKVSGTDTDHTFTVTNTGSYSATTVTDSTFAAPYSFKGGSYPGTGGTCGGTIAASASCTIVIRFSPVAAGTFTATTTLNYNDGGATTTSTRPLTGVGILVASLSVTNPTANPYDFGTMTVGAAEADVTLTVQNSGNGPASSIAESGLATPFLFKDGAYPGTGGTCGTTLAASASCTIVVGFLPTSAGTWTDTLNLTYADGSGATPTLSHDFQGIAGSSALLTISDGPTYDFGSRTIGSDTDQTFTVSNTGGSTATALSGGGLAAPFTYAGGSYPGTGGTCSTSLVSGASCLIVVRFSPVAGGGFSSTVTLNYHDGLSTTLVNRAVTGTGGTAANLSISDSPSYSFGTVAKSYTSDKTLTVTNLGGTTASAIIASGLSAPLTFKGGSYPGTGGTCGTTLSASASCTMVVRFAPTGASSSNATLTLDYNDGNAATSTNLPLAGIGATISKIVGGGSHSCALYSTGIVKCWGSDSNGQLGNGGANSDSASPVLVNGISTATDLTAGSHHTCALLASGRIQCWGSDSHGQLGDDASLTDRSSPVYVATYTDFTQVSAGGDLTCGRRSGGTVECWGDDSEGGNGDNAGFADNPTPVTVNGLLNMVDVSVGREHACGHRSSGVLRCWGSGTSGELGNSSTSNSGTPVIPTGGTNTAVSVISGGDTSCAILSGGSVECWGSDDNGQLGDNVTLSNQNSPTTIPGLANSSQISLGSKHGCALTSGSTITCWGDDFYGQLGDDVSTTDQPTPVAVTGLSGVSLIGVGEYHSCAVLSTGLSYCWGSNASSQLGSGSVSPQESTPVQVLGL